MKPLILSGLLLSGILVKTLAAIENVTWMARLEGMYMSENNSTPFGRIGFAMDMIRETDGSLHGRIQSDRETYFDFKFWINEKGEILFRETGALGDGFVQSYEMEVINAEGDTLTFATREKPVLLLAKVTADGSRLRVNATVRGRPHVDLDMARVLDEHVISKFRADQARAKEMPAGSALKQFFVAAAAKTVDAKLPKAEQARLHVAESQKLEARIEKASPSEFSGLAFMMKGHLDIAIELDPSFDQAHFALAMWYLLSPQLAPQSKAKVNEILATLYTLNSPLADVLRRKMAGRN